jgi:hypothetical protein
MADSSILGNLDPLIDKVKGFFRSSPTGGAGTGTRDGAVPAGGQSTVSAPTDVRFKNLRNEAINTDMRVKIRVPDNYLVRLTSGSKNELMDLGGIIFPYTPQIQMEWSADYASMQPMHSNFAQHFYQRSKVSAINIQGKFTVQNDTDAAVYLATQHLLRSLVKMKSGGLKAGDPDSGSPPPVCRLDAYGSFMLDNVPIVIQSFRIELPDTVDYYTIGRGDNTTYDRSSVPTVSSISLTCLPMYSRAEQQKFNVSSWLSNKDVRRSGFL